VTDTLFRSVAESMEEAVVNALLAARPVGAAAGGPGIPLPVSQLPAGLF
jgi:L-aminopeptidase/D-esterase-like protein